MDVTIRKATEQDIEALVRLVAQLDLTRGPGLTVEQGARILKKIATYPNYAVYVAEAPDRRIVGMFELLVMDNLAHGGAPSAIVEDVCVDETRRGQGVGRAMMTFAMDLARRHGCFKLALSSNRVRTAAHEFYRNLGFSQHGLSFQVDLQTPAPNAQPGAATDGTRPRR